MKGKICDNLQGTQYQILDRYTFHDEYRGVTSTESSASWVQSSSSLDLAVEASMRLFFSHPLIHPPIGLKWELFIRISTPTHDAKRFFSKIQNSSSLSCAFWNIGKPTLHSAIPGRVLSPGPQIYLKGSGLDQSLRGHLTESSMNMDQS